MLTYINDLWSTAAELLKTKRDQFEAWVASWLPGMKTKIIAGLGAVGMAAAVLQEYITGLPIESLVTPTKLAMINAGLFTMAYWFKRLADKE